MNTVPARAALLLGAVAIILGACSVPDSGGGAGPTQRTVELVMTDQLTSEPAEVEVRRGETVTFSVRNTSDEAHEAYIGTDAEQRMHETDHFGTSTDEQVGTPHHGYGIHIAPFGTGQLTYAFQDPDLAELVIGCHYPGHYEAGERVVITVSDG